MHMHTHTPHSLPFTITHSRTACLCIYCTERTDFSCFLLPTLPLAFKYHLQKNVEIEEGNDSMWLLSKERNILHN